MKRRKIFAGNWKMYTTASEAAALVGEIVGGLGDVKGREVAVFPPALYVREAVRLAAGRIDVGVQNMYFEKEGAFTGELSPAMVRDAGARYALIGHSERRHVFGEDDALIRRKVLAALEHGLDPMLCEGELLDEREAGRTEEVLERQLRMALDGVDASLMGRVVIAYEPVWAIGTGRVATPEIAGAAHAFVRSVLAGLYGAEIAGSASVLYGGSVKPDNIAGLWAVEDIDGVLVGGASLKSKSFLDIIRVQ